MNVIRTSKAAKFILVFVLTISLFSWSPVASFADSELSEDKQRLLEIYDLLKDAHLSGTSEDQIALGAIYGMIWSLDDPYTDYFTDEEFDEFIQGIEMQYHNIGVILEEDENGFYISGVIDNSPAKKAGLKSDDRILSLNGTLLKGLSVFEVMDLIDEEETITMIIERDNKEMTYELTKATFQLPDITSELLPNNIGYIRIYSISSIIDQEFAQHVKQLKDKHAAKFIVDLRDNPGGFMDAAINLSNHLIEEGPIVKIKNRNGEETVYEANEGTKWDDPLVLLVDENTASAAEMITAVVKDYKVGTIIGENTFGKGVIQSLIELDHGGVLKLTVDQYFSPKGNKIHEVGIKPDIVVNAQNDPLDFAKRFLQEGSSLTIEANNKLLQGKTALPYSSLDSNKTRYIPLKALTKVFGGELLWDNETKVVSYTLGDNEHSWKANDGKSELIIQNGVSYLPVNSLAKLYPLLHKSADKETIRFTLSY